MNQRQLNLAAKLYTLGTMAHIEEIDRSPKGRVRLRAKRMAERALGRYGLVLGDITKIEDAIAFAQQWHHSGARA